VAPNPSRPIPGDELPPSAYERYADVFSRAYSQTRSIPMSLEILDAYRTHEAHTLPADIGFHGRVVALAASLFNLPAERLFEPGRRKDVTSARYVAAWILRRHHWAHAKIGELFNLDHSTIVHGVRKVGSTNHLRLAAVKAELLIDLNPDHLR